VILTDPDLVKDQARPRDPLRITLPWWVETSKVVSGDLRNTSARGWKHAGNRVARMEIEAGYKYVHGMLTWLDDVIRLSEGLTTTSASMGDSTSFPIMPLLTAFAAETAGTPHLWGAGDDAVIANCTDESVRVFESTITSCGAVLSRGDPKKGKPNKIFKHPQKFNFCEEIYEVVGKRLQLRKFYHTSLWSAPPGGSKGHIDWFNQPSSVLEHAHRVGLKGTRALWPYTKTAQLHRAAYALGLPLGHPVELGGIYHPSFPTGTRSIKDPDHRTAWLSTLSQVSVLDWATGNGLSPLPVGTSQESRNIAKTRLKGLTRLLLSESKTPVYTTSPGSEALKNLEIKDVGDMIAGMVTSWEVYHRRAPPEVKGPRVRTAAGSFKRKLYRKPQIPKNLSLAGTLRDVAKKKSIRIDARVNIFDDTNHAVRAYGLMPFVVPKVDKLRFQWQRLSRWKTGEAYLVPQERG